MMGWSQPHYASIHPGKRGSDLDPVRQIADVRTVFVMNDELLLHGLVHLLGEADGMQIVGDFRHDDDLVDRLRLVRPELLIVDADHGVQLATLRTELEPAPKVVIVMDGEESPGRALELIRSGADALVDRRSPSADVLSAVARVLDGQTALDPHSANTLVAEVRSQGTTSESDYAGLLTRREKEVLALLTEGLDNRAIATDLFISEATVKFHLHNIMDKFGVHKRAALVSAALRGGARGGVGGLRPEARTR
jgi:DNA-binding NarL/FixJ family response regulator